MGREPDYVTVNRAMRVGQYNAVVMRWLNEDTGYVVFRCSQAVDLHTADQMAKTWAAQSRLEYRQHGGGV